MYLNPKLELQQQCLPPIDSVDCDDEVASLVQCDVQLGAARRYLHQVERSLHLVPRARHLQPLHVGDKSVIIQDFALFSKNVIEKG